MLDMEGSGLYESLSSKIMGLVMHIFYTLVTLVRGRKKGNVPT